MMSLSTVSIVPGEAARPCDTSARMQTGMRSQTRWRGERVQVTKTSDNSPAQDLSELQILPSSLGKSRLKLTDGNSPDSVAQTDCADLMRLELLDIGRRLMPLCYNLISCRNTVDGVQSLVQSTQIRVWIDVVRLVVFIQRFCDCPDVLQRQRRERSSKGRTCARWTHVDDEEASATDEAHDDEEKDKVNLLHELPSRNVNVLMMAFGPGLILVLADASIAPRQIVSRR